MNTTKEKAKGPKYQDVAKPPEILRFREKGQIIEGIFERVIETDIGEAESLKSAVIKDVEGKRWQVALNNTLSYYFQTVKAGDAVRLTHMGQEPFKHPTKGMTKRNLYRFESAPSDG